MQKKTKPNKNKIIWTLILLVILIMLLPIVAVRSGKFILPSEEEQTFPTEGYVHSSPVLSDIDNDGKLEIIAGDNSNDFSSGKVYVWNDNGSIVQGWPKTTIGGVFASPAVGNIDEDGDLEIIVGSGDVFAQGEVNVWNADGTIVHGWPKQMNWGFQTPALGDLDKDGILDIVVSYFGNKIYAWHGDGTAVRGWPVNTQHWPTPVALADLDHDNRLEVVAGEYYVGYGPTNVSVWNDDGKLLRGWPQTTGQSAGYPVIADIDSDNDFEIIVGSFDNNIYVWNIDGTFVHGWPQTADGAMNRLSPAVGDINNDGSLEILLGACRNLGTGKMYAWNHNGTIVNGWPRPTTACIESSAALSDVDSDGKLEIFVGSDASSGQNNFFAWNDDGTPLPGWPKNLEGTSIYSSPAIGDIDNDVTADVVVGTGYGVHLIRIGNFYKAYLDWPMYRHDNRRSGLFLPRPAEVSDLFHNICADFLCQAVQGPGPNECNVNRDCSHKACVDEICQVVSGPGPDQCQANQDCHDDPPAIDIKNSIPYNIGNDTWIVNITANATDDIDLINIKIYADDTLKNICNFNGVHDTIGTCLYVGEFSYGNHTYYGTATDNAGHTTFSDIKSFMVP